MDTLPLPSPTYPQSATGLKTGSTDSALYCLSATAERDGMELIAVILKSPTSTQRFEGAKVLLNYGFAAYGIADIQPNTPLAPIPVTLGERGSIMPRISGSTSLLAEKAKLSDLSVTVEVSESLAAPVEEGQQIGTLTVQSGGEILRTIPIVAGESVALLSYGQILLKCLRCAFFAL